MVTDLPPLALFTELLPPLLLLLLLQPPLLTLLQLLALALTLTARRFLLITEVWLVGDYGVVSRGVRCG